MIFTRVLLLIFILLSFAIASGEACLEGLPIQKIEIQGLERTDEKVILRELSFQEGSLYADTAIKNTVRRLESLDLFADIQVSCKPNANAQILTFQITEIFPFIPAPAGKKTDQDGWMLGGALAYLNVLGQDIRAEFQYRTSVSPWFESNEFAIYVSSPWFFDLPVGFNLEILRTDSYDELRNYDAASWLLDLDLTWNFKKPYALLTSLAYRHLDDFGSVPEAGIGFSVDRRDAPLDSRLGVYEEFKITGVGFLFDSEESYVEYLVDLRAYYTIKKFISGASALFRYRAGDVSFFDRLHHGGANTFRGYEADSSRYGKNELLLNFEERFILVERRPFSIQGINLFYGIQLVGGLDGSLLFNASNPKMKDFSGAIYGGIHFLIPALERLRIEVGYSPDKKEPKIFVGLYEKNVAARWRSR